MPQQEPHMPTLWHMPWYCTGREGIEHRTLFYWQLCRLIIAAAKVHGQHVPLEHETSTTVSPGSLAGCSTCPLVNQTNNHQAPRELTHVVHCAKL